MIKIIDGKRYDTDRAKCVYAWSNGHFVTDFRYRSKDLYLTKSGVWFIHHEGGAMSDMAVSVGNGTAGSETIESVSGKDAFGFLEAHSDDSGASDAISQHFADQVVDV